LSFLSTEWGEMAILIQIWNQAFFEHHGKATIIYYSMQDARYKYGIGHKL
jgi:hypothetical protein